MMNDRRIILICIISIYTTTCKHVGINPLFTSEHGKEIIVPDFISDSLTLYFENNDYVVISYIDSSDCTYCELKPLSYWKYYQEDLDKHGICILIFTQNPDHKEIKSFFDELHINYPIIIDYCGQFAQKNTLSNNTFIINKDMKTVWNGSPVLDYRDWNQFLKMIDLSKSKRLPK